MTDGTDATPGAARQTEQDGAGAESAGAPAEVSACPHPEAIGRRWSDSISAERQGELLAIRDAWDAPDADHGKRRGPFDGTELTGADVAWFAEQVRDKYGSVSNLHLEGARLVEAHLEGADLNLADLKHAYLFEAHLEGARLVEAHLEGADLLYAHLEEANFLQAHLEGADLRLAYLEGADLSGAHLEGANPREAHLEGAYLRSAHLEGADLGEAHLEGARLNWAHLEGAKLRAAHLERANLSGAHLEGAYLFEAHLEGADLGQAHLEGVNLLQAHLEGANLSLAHLESKAFAADDPELVRIRHWASDFPSLLPPTDLRSTFLDLATDLAQTALSSPDAPAWQHTGPRLADVHWGGANLIVTAWESVATLADEHVAAQTRYDAGARKLRTTRTEEYRAAGRAYRLLSVALRDQGLSTEATRFHYRAEVMDRRALFYRRGLGRWLFSWLLGTFAGYGDRLGRLFATYAVVVGAFALAMLLAAVQVKANQPLSPATLQDVLVLSVTSFHGRGIQPPGLQLDDALATLAGAEAVFGLLIEGLFIAAFTRRVTGG
jgi:uncharacterized protein YjbI with pentapeptide repeats